MKTIGEYIKEARESKGYSQNELARMSRIARANIGHWERGETFPSIINLIPVADALGITLDELVGRRQKDDTEVL